MEKLKILVTSKLNVEPSICRKWLVLDTHLTDAHTHASLSNYRSPPKPNYAGATAGGAYLLSAKQRYNERVKTAVQGLLKAADALKNGDSKAAKTYLDGEDAGSWKDLTAAGYLLSNAFRRNSTTAPDSLPSVKVGL